MSDQKASNDAVQQAMDATIARSHPDTQRKIRGVARDASCESKDPLADEVRRMLSFCEPGRVDYTFHAVTIDKLRSALHAREVAVARLVEAAKAIVGDPPGRMSVFVANYGRLVDALAAFAGPTQGGQ